MERQTLDKKLPPNCPITQDKYWREACAWWGVLKCKVVSALDRTEYLEDIADWCANSYNLAKATVAQPKD